MCHADLGVHPHQCVRVCPGAVCGKGGRDVVTLSLSIQYRACGKIWMRRETTERDESVLIRACIWESRHYVFPLAPLPGLWLQLRFT